MEHQRTDLRCGFPSETASMMRLNYHRQVVKHDLGLEPFWLAILQIQQAEQMAILIHDDSALLSGDGHLTDLIRSSSILSNYFELMILA